MSAICRNTGLRAVNEGTMKSTAPSITARPTPEEKRLFAAVAARRQISESTLALIAIRFFEVVSYGRAGPQMPARFSLAQIDQISRTVRHTPEVMVKVTGGGTRRGAVAAHFAYLSRQGTLGRARGHPKVLERTQ